MTGTILDDIVENRRVEVERAGKQVPLSKLEAKIEANEAPREFASMLRRQQVRVIAEIKRASPSHGPFDQMLDARILAQEYAGNGAAAISCVTEGRYFHGDQFMIHRARSLMPLPVLRKDFIFDEYQVYESRALKADAILLIADILNDVQLRLLIRRARSLGMDALVEAHSAEHVQRAVESGARVIGINNRDLKTMEVDLQQTARLAGLVPDDRILVSESGVASAEDLRELAEYGADAVLVGTVLMQSDDPGARLTPLTDVAASPGSRGT